MLKHGPGARHHPYVLMDILIFLRKLSVHQPPLPLLTPRPRGLPALAGEMSSFLRATGEGQRVTLASYLGETRG